MASASPTAPQRCSTSSSARTPSRGSPQRSERFAALHDHYTEEVGFTRTFNIAATCVSFVLTGQEGFGTVELTHRRARAGAHIAELPAYGPSCPDHRRRRQHARAGRRRTTGGRLRHDYGRKR